jgi:hypothetical protein
MGRRVRPVDEPEPDRDPCRVAADVDQDHRQAQERDVTR